jgi:hypothetical protein
MRDGSASSEKQDSDTDPHQSEKVETLRVILELWRVEVWEKVRKRIRS